MEHSDVTGCTSGASEAIEIAIIYPHRSREVSVSEFGFIEE